MKFLKTIRFDPSDSIVFELSAGPGEWAVPGGSIFSSACEDALAGKAKQSFSNGFLSLESYGHSTFVSVAEASQERISRLIANLARLFIERYGAPSLNEAMNVAAAEVAFTQEMCSGAPMNAVFTVRRYFDKSGEMRETFRMIKPQHETLHARIWDVVEDER